MEVELYKPKIKKISPYHLNHLYNKINSCRNYKKKIDRFLKLVDYTEFLWV